MAGIEGQPAAKRQKPAQHVAVFITGIRTPVNHPVLSDLGYRCLWDVQADSAVTTLQYFLDQGPGALATFGR